MRAQSASELLDVQIARLAERQHGVVSRRQLLAIGFKPNALGRRLTAGRLHAVHRGVYAVGHRALSREGHLMAAVLACGRDAVLSHRTTGALWGLRPSATAVEVSTRSRSGRERRPGIVVHHVLLDPSEVTERDGMPITTPTRTLLDLAAVLPPGALARAVEAAERPRIFDLAALDALFAGYPGRAGAPALRAAVALHQPRLELTCSELERLFLELCECHDLEAPQVNVPVGPYVVDFLWRRHRLIAETDGADTHSTRAAFERDRARDAELMAAGFRVVRFTHRRVTDHPAAVVRALRALLHA